VKQWSPSPPSEHFRVPSSSVYVGIDVACALGKRLPICVVSAGHPLMPLAIPKHLAALIPRGVGNKEIATVAPFHEAALGVVSAINRIVIEMDGRSIGLLSMRRPLHLQQVPGHRRTNSDAAACHRSEPPLLPSGRAYASRAPIIWVLAAI
jgi:hypothetical protein